MEKKLVIFDMNGVLCHRCKKNNTINGFKIIKNKRLSVIVRPGIIDFLNRCLEDYDIAFWTSGSERALSDFINYIADRLDFNPLFIWYHGKIKDIKLVLEEYSDYTEDNIVIIDDTYKKISMNKNFIVPDKFDITTNDINFHIEKLEDLYYEIVNIL